jgi:hypothetical protein
LPVQRAANCIADVKYLGLPLGWSKDTSPDNWENGLGKIGGLLLTAFAVMLGAPFWFDALGKLATTVQSSTKEAFNSSPPPRDPIDVRVAAPGTFFSGDAAAPYYVIPSSRVPPPTALPGIPMANHTRTDEVLDFGWPIRTAASPGARRWYG